MKLENTRPGAVCSKCNKTLYSIHEGEFGGEIGFCKHCGYWRALTPGARRDALARQRKEDESRIRKYRLSLIGGGLSAAVILVLVIYITVFLPIARYDDAAAVMLAGRYEEAGEKFLRMGGYRDAAYQAEACIALDEMQSGSVAGVEAMMDEAVNDGRFCTAAVEIAEQWREYGIRDEDALRLVNDSRLMNTQDIQRIHDLYVRIQLAMTGLEAENYVVFDAEGDGQEELAVQTVTGQVLVYSLTQEGPRGIELSAGKLSSIWMTLAQNAQAAGDIDRAVNNAQTAVRALKNEETLALLSGVSQEAAEQKEQEGRIEEAAQILEALVRETGAEDHFKAYYDMQYRYAGTLDAENAFAAWNAFRAEFSELLNGYGYEQSAGLVSGNLRLSYAKALASHGEERCIDELRQAAAEGADVSAEMQGIIEQYPVGVTKTRLRLLEAELETDAGRAQAIREEAGAEAEKTLTAWQAAGLSGEEAMNMMLLCEKEQLNIGMADAAAIWRSAMEAAAEPWKLKQYVFVEWNAEAHESLLGIDESGCVFALGMTEEGMTAKMQADTGIAGARIEVLREDSRMLLATDDTASFAVLSVDADWNAAWMQHETGLSDVSCDGQTIAYGRDLAGSVQRSSRWVWTIDGGQEAVRTGIEWGKENYAYPQDDAALITRWFEAHAYGIEEEKQLLTTNETDWQVGRSNELLSALPQPDDPAQVSVELYQRAGNVTRWAVAYRAQGNSVKAYVSCIQTADGGVQKSYLAGASYSFGVSDMAAGDESVDILPFGEKIQTQLADRNDYHIYRMLLPTTAAVKLQWQAGEKDQESNAFAIELFSEENASVPHAAWQVPHKRDAMESNVFYLKQGVYYVRVSALQSKQVEYSLTLAASDEMYAELENNDETQRATRIELNTSYYGSLQTMKSSALNTREDIDIYSFHLDDTSRVQIRIGAQKASSSDSGRLVCSLHDGLTGRQLGSTTLTNVQTAADTPAAYLAAGDYYVLVMKGSSKYTGAYEVMVNAQAAAGAEAEGNDTAEMANRIGLNQAVEASFMREGDIDWYAFTLEQDSLIQPMMRFTPLSQSGKAFELRLHRGESVISYVKINGKESEKVIAPIPLQAGEYRLQLVNTAQGSAVPYTVQVGQIGIARAEQEGNDTEADAHRIVLGETVTGMASDEKDVDWFCLQLDQEKVITLQIELENAPDSRSVYQVRGEQNGSRFLNEGVGNGGYSVQMRVRPGTYYFSMKCIESTAARYKITFIEN